MKSWLTIAVVPDGFQFLALFVDATTKATFLLFVSWLIVILLRRQSAAVRHRVWALLIYGLIAMPFLSWMVPGWRLVVFHAAPRTTAAILPATIPVSSDTGGVATPRYSTPGRVAVEGRSPVPATAVGERAAFARAARPTVRGRDRIKSWERSRHGSDLGRSRRITRGLGIRGFRDRVADLTRLDRQPTAPAPGATGDRRRLAASARVDPPKVVDP